MEVSQIFKKAEGVYKTSAERNAYVKGYIDGLNEKFAESDDFYEKLAKGLRELWPSGEKSGKYPWRDSVKNLKARLQFIWKDRNFKGKHSLDDCLAVARRYLAQYEQNVTYMQTLRYFIFKQDKMISSDGKGKITYKSTFADMLEDNVSYSNDYFNPMSEEEMGAYITPDGELV